MQSVQREPNKKLSKKWKLAFIIALLIFIAAFVYISRPHEIIIEPTDEEIIILQVEPEDIIELTIKPKKGKSYTLEQIEADSFRLKGDENYQLDIDMVSDMFDIAASITAVDAMIESIDIIKAREYGIDENSLKVKIVLNTGKTHTYILGYEIKTEVPMRYMYCANSGTIYVTKINYPDILNYTIKELHTVPPLNFSSELVDSMQISENTGRNIEIIRREDMWSFVSPIKYPISNDSAKKLCDNIEAMRLAVFESEAAESKLNNYGLDEPRAKVTFNIAKSNVSVTNIIDDNKDSYEIDEHSIQLLLGDDFDDIGFYCLYYGNIYKASHLSMGFLLQMDIEEMYIKNPVNIAINALKEMSIIRADERNIYTLDFVETVLPNNQISTDEYGNILYDMCVYKNGQEIESMEWTSKYMLLTQLNIDGTLPYDFTPESSPLLIIKLIYEGGERNITFYPYDALHAAMSIDDIFIHYISLDKLSEIEL